MRLCNTDIGDHSAEGKIVIEPRPGVERISGVLGKTKGVLSFLPEFYLFEIMAIKA